MGRPEFTRDEQYLINCTLSPSASRIASHAAWWQLAVASGLFGFGIYSEVPVMLYAGFVTLVAFKVQEMIQGRRWGPLWSSVFQKYEEALSDRTLRDNDET
jgi:hypothetical protein